MKQIATDIIEAVNQRRRINSLYLISEANPSFCIQVNGLTVICLAELGFMSVAKETTTRLLASPLYDSNNGLFYSEINEKLEVTNS